MERTTSSVFISISTFFFTFLSKLSNTHTSLNNPIGCYLPPFITATNLSIWGNQKSATEARWWASGICLTLAKDTTEENILKERRVALDYLATFKQYSCKHWLNPHQQNSMSVNTSGIGIGLLLAWNAARFTSERCLPLESMSLF